LSLHHIISAHCEHSIMLSSVCEVLFETECWVISQANQSTILSP